MYNTCVFVGLAIYCYSDHKTDVTGEFTLKKLLQKMYNTCVFASLAYMSLIMKQTSPWNSVCMTILCDPN